MSHFATAYSDRLAEDTAIKEAALGIKDTLPQIPDLALLFYTRHYKPSLLYDLVHVTLRPKDIIGIKAPLILYEDRVSSRGVALLCIKNEEISLKSYFLDENIPEKIEVGVRESLRGITRLKLVCGFLSPAVSPINYIRGIKVALGKNAPLVTSGFHPSEKSGYSHILNTSLGSNILHLECGGNMSALQQRVTGFIPLSRPFTLTKVDSDRNIILEINNNPAAEIYKNYLEEKYELLKDREMYDLYPLGIASGDSYRMISIKKILGDDSLLYLGNAGQGDQATLMINNQGAFKENLNQAVTCARQAMRPGLALVFNSTLKLRLFGEKLAQEAVLIKKAVGENCKVIGLYSDFHIAYNRDIYELIMEEGAMHLTFLNI